ncbi:hypothetical protein EST38_g13767 [Candolleomyces aberdarensis]|uniref:SAP domain-containing protein n=1 Tax=Candolleomyces aberdarensis TaxID=2316362 RepID=A0A4Q2CZ51_9AGAR|nr:hypothetical protein EST38_g13767 [Candolleomyces aberdarensis]
MGVNNDEAVVVLLAIASALEKRKHLQATDTDNAARIQHLGKCISNQISTLQRFVSASAVAKNKQKALVGTLRDEERKLQDAIDAERDLLAELAAVQRKASSSSSFQPAAFQHLYSSGLSGANLDRLRELVTSLEGVWVSPKTYRAHQKKRKLEEIIDYHDRDLASTFISAGFTPRAPITITQPAWTTQLQTSALLSSSPIAECRSGSSDLESAARLELQSIRYDLIGLTLALPLSLEFRSSPGQATLKLEQFSPTLTYEYSGLINTPPYDLITSPANTLFLDLEFRLHTRAERLKELKLISDEHNFQLLFSSVEKNVQAALNKMFSWRRELWWERYRQAQAELHAQAQPSVFLPPNIETTRYLQLYNYGDPQYAPFVMSALLLILVLHLIFHGSHALSEVVLASLQDQIDNLKDLIGEGRLRQLKNSIPSSVSTVINSFDLEPCVRRFVQCPKCFALYPAADSYPDVCTYREASDSPSCSTKMVRTRQVRGTVKDVPIKYYVHQDFKEWLGRFLCRPEIEDCIDRSNAKFKDRQGHGNGSGAAPLVHDILEAKAIQDFQWPDGKPFYDCRPDELKLFFSLSGDGFNPLSNKQAKQSISSTGIYLFCLNLPLEERQKPENVYLAGVIPGPDKPSATQINHYTSLVADDFLTFWRTGVRYTRTSRRKDGVLSLAALMPVMSDALGGRQLCGYGSITSQYFCTFCWLSLSDIENFNRSTWPARDLDKHRFWAEQWLKADESTRIKLFKDHGIRYTPLFRLPYFNPITFTIVDTMHNLFLGLLRRHCRWIWGMDLDVGEGEGEFRPPGIGGKLPSHPSVQRMAEGRRALEFNNVEALTKTKSDVLFHLCLEFDLRRGGKKKDFLRELLRWRQKQETFMPEPTFRPSAEANPGTGATNFDIDRAESDSEMSSMSQSDQTLSETESEASSLSALSPSKGVLEEQSSHSFPEADREVLEAAESILSRGLKLSGLRKSVLQALCIRKGIQLPSDAIKKTMITALEEWRSQQSKLHANKRVPKRTTVVLGNTILPAVAEDNRKTLLPRWVDPAPIRAGQKKQGKLSADQWRSFCTIHLVITLIRLWGNLPEDSRRYQMLTNFIDLVNAVEVASMLTTSAEHMSVFRVSMSRYLVNLKTLYKEAAIVQNHHLALHIPDFLELWGPSPQTRGFGWERYNYTLQQIPTNKRIGEAATLP